MSADASQVTPDKEAACLSCRRSKVKCKKSPTVSKCERCAASGLECMIPSFHIGRKKGVKNKRSGLEKAIHQIEKAIKQTNGNVTDLRQLLNLTNHAGVSSHVNERPVGSQIHTTSSPARRIDDEHIEYNDIENPLQLLARASDLQSLSAQDSSSQHAKPKTVRIENQLNVSRFFVPLRATPDIGSNPKLTDLDPIDIGLVTEEEAQDLILFFHQKLAHTRWGLDPAIHTFQFVRSQSAFLLTSMLAAAALFIPLAAALARRLQIHRDRLAGQVIVHRLRSVEIVLAFMINIPWMHPGQHSADDDTGLYISTALSISMDLSLNKIVLPSSFLSEEAVGRISRADCIDATKALTMDGFEDVPPDSDWGRKLLCRRERVWIALFVLERGVCLARGRSYSVPITPLLKHCEAWLANELTHTGDGAMLSMAILRRDLDALFDTVRSRCDSYRVIDIGSKVAQEIEDTIDKFYAKWFATWTTAIGLGQQQTLPPYVDILVTHTRLSTYTGVINHPTAPLEVKRQFRASAVSSALNVMRVAIQGEGKLASMPNNTVIMICFAACVAVRLSAGPSEATSHLAPSILNLVEETAAVLYRIGHHTPHRNGASAVYAQCLKELVQEASKYAQPNESRGEVRPIPMTDIDLDMMRITHEVPPPPAQQYPIANDWMVPLHFAQFSSDDQILQSLLNAEPDFNAMLPSLDAGNPDYAWMSFMNAPNLGF